MTASTGIDLLTGGLPAQRAAADDDTAFLRQIAALAGSPDGTDAPVFRLTSVLTAPDGSFRGVLLHGAIGAVRATALAVEALRESDNSPIDVDAPDLMAVVGQPRWWNLREAADGTWHGEPAAYGAASPNAVLGTRVTFES